MNIFFVSHLALISTLASGSSYSNLRASKRQMQAVFPLYNQQCDNDEGPLHVDDAETFGTKKYHEGKPAVALGDCPDPLRGACSQKSKTEAFLEGPIDCGGKGWFCRMHEEPGWPDINLDPNTNFGYCNTTEALEDDDFEEAGHCHGSDSDEAYYWAVRDHWYRQYNGRLRCCCGWDDLVTEGLIVNRCDHRRLVTREESLEGCSDANDEEEGATPYNGGCDETNAPALDQPISRDDDSRCWEVSRFGEPSDDESEDDEDSNSSSDDEEENSPSDESEESEDNDSDASDDEEEEEEDNSGEESEDVEDDENDSGDDEESDSEDESEESGDSEDEDSEASQDEDDDDEGFDDDSFDDDDDDDNDDNDDDDCLDDASFGFQGIPTQNCDWVADRAETICSQQSGGATVSESCPMACGDCENESGDDESEDSDGSGDEDNGMDERAFRFGWGPLRLLEQARAV